MRVWYLPIIVTSLWKLQKVTDELLTIPCPIWWFMNKTELEMHDTSVCLESVSVTLRVVEPTRDFNLKLRDIG